ncbi:MAG: hypothetical protein JW941_06900, partial [Candidatus Coatesbacteria bacterium]|nr:hypothetical protein [Candidatus Coatesbacteria bacterium]
DRKFLRFPDNGRKGGIEGMGDGGWGMKYLEQLQHRLGAGLSIDEECDSKLQVICGQLRS